MLILSGCLAVGFPSRPSGAALRETVAAGYWTNAATWKDGVIPAEGDTVVIHHAVTLDESTSALAGFTNTATLTFRGWDTRLTASEVTLAALVTHPAQSDTTGTPGVYADWTPDNRVWIECSNLIVTAQGEINTNGKGYLGGEEFHTSGQGPGGGPRTGSSSAQGAGYGGTGGRGRDGPGGVTYGSPHEPIDPGSGGGRGYQVGGGNGGGAVRIIATGAAIVKGSITANGAISANDHCGGGSGGSIWITCETISGAGTLSANGGNLTGNRNTGSAGGGGRIAIDYNAAKQALRPQPALRFSTTPGYGNPNGTQYVAQLPERKGGIGTLYLPDGTLLTDALADTVRDTSLYGVVSWAPASILVNNTVVVFAADDVVIAWPDTVAVIGDDLVPMGTESRFAVATTTDFAPGHVVVTGLLDVVVANFTYQGGNFDLPSGRFNLTVTNHACFSGGNVTVRDGAKLYLSAKTAVVGGNLALNGTGTECSLLAQGPTNALGADHAFLIEVKGNITVANGAVLSPRSDPLLGGSPLIRAGRVIVEADGEINAEGTGYAEGTGKTIPDALGKGIAGGKYGNDAGGGGAHGGQGGTGRYGGRHQPLTYGSEKGPVLAGSGGGSGWSRYQGGAGGGVIRIEAQRRIQVDGIMTARGRDEQSGGRHAGGGAGGSIYLRCHTFAGAATGQLIADGGNMGSGTHSDQGGAGGGGRIAVWRFNHHYAGNASANAGIGGYEVSGQMAGHGTIHWGDIPPLSTVLVIR